MLDLANLHFYIVQGSTPLINFPGKRKRKKKKKQPKSAAATYTTPMQVMPQHPNTGNVHEMKLIGVIDQKALAIERMGGGGGRGEGGLCVT